MIMAQRIFTNVLGALMIITFSVAVMILVLNPLEVRPGSDLFLWFGNLLVAGFGFLAAMIIVDPMDY